MKFTIEIDESKLIKDGKRYEPTGEFRKPQRGEFFVTETGLTCLVRQATLSYNTPRIILREAWEWPSWLKGWGIAMDECGSTYLYEHTPYRDSACWNANEDANMGSYVSIENIVYRCWFLCIPNFTPPTITDWTKPVLNPNYVAPENPS